MPPVKLGQGVVFRPGTAFDERWAPNQFLSGFVTSISGDDASIVVFPDVYAPFYEMRVKRDDALSQDRTWTPSVGEDQEMPEAPSDGQIYGRRNQAWTPISGEDQGFLQAVIIADAPPGPGLPGMAWFDTTINNFYIFEQGKWVEPAHVNPAEEISVNIVPPFISGIVDENEVLTCSTGDWTSQPITYAYQWYHEVTPIPDTDNTHTISAGDVGHDLTCVVTATNRIGLSQPATSNIISVKAPINVAPPLVTGAVAVGGVFTCAPGSWSSTSSTIMIAFQWMRDGSPIAGEVANTYTIVSGDISKVISCVVTASNLIGSTSLSSNTVPITAPTIITAPVASNPLLFAGGEDPASCSTGIWTSIPTSYAYQWQRNGVNISGATSNTFNTILGDGTGTNITCNVIATNAIGSSAPATSNSLVLLRAAELNPLTVDNATVDGFQVKHNNTFHGGARSLPQASKTTGKWMFDVHIDVITATETAFGLLQDGISYNFMNLGVAVDKLGQLYVKDVFRRNLGTLVSNHNLSFVVDLDNKLLWVRTVTFDSIYGPWNGDTSAVAGVSGGLSLAGLTTPMAPAVVFGITGASPTETCFFNTGVVQPLNATPVGFTPGWSM